MIHLLTAIIAAGSTGAAVALLPAGPPAVAVLVGSAALVVLSLHDAMRSTDAPR